MKIKILFGSDVANRLLMEEDNVEGDAVPDEGEGSYAYGVPEDDGSPILLPDEEEEAPQPVEAAEDDGVNPVRLRPVLRVALSSS